MFNPFPPRLAKSGPFVTVFYSVKCQTILLIKGEPLDGKGLIFLEFYSHIHVAKVKQKKTLVSLNVKIFLINILLKRSYIVCRSKLLILMIYFLLIT